MQKQVNGESNVTNRPSHKQSYTGIRAFWLQLSGSLIVLVSVAILMQLVYHQRIYAISLKQTNMLTTNVTTAAQGTLTDSNGQLTFTAVVTTTLRNTNIVAHVHKDNCMGTILFALPAKSSGPSGQVTLEQSFTSGVPSTIPQIWFFNVHDADVTDPSTGHPWSIGCLHFKPSHGGTQAHANFRNSKVTIA